MGTQMRKPVAYRKNQPGLRLVLAKDADYAALNLDVVGSDQDRSHFGICRLQANLAKPFAIEALEGRIFATNQRYDNVARVGDLGLLADHVVPIHDVILDHRGSLDLQDKGIAATREI